MPVRKILAISARCAAVLVACAACIAGCGGRSTTIPAAGSTSSSLLVNSANSVTIPSSNGVSGTFSLMTAASFPSGVTAAVTAVSSGAPSPLSAGRQTQSATAIATWKLTFSGFGSTAAGSLGSAPSVSLTGLSGPASLVVELWDATSGETVPLSFLYNSAQSTATTSVYVASGTTFQITFADVFYLEVVSGSGVLPSASPSASPSAGPSPSSSASAVPSTAPTTLPVNVTGSPGIALPNATLGSIAYASTALVFDALALGPIAPSGNMTVTQYGGQPPNGCAPPAQSGGSGTVKGVVYAVETSFSADNVFGTDSTPLETTYTGTLPTGTYYAYYAQEGACSGTGSQVGSVVASSSAFTGGSSSSFQTYLNGNSDFDVTPGNTYVIEVFYQ